MDTVTISDLLSVEDIGTNDVLPIVNGGSTKKVSIDQLGDVFTTKPYVTNKIQEAIAAATGEFSFTPIVVQTLPTEDIDVHTIYLVPKTGEAGDVYDEYIYVNDTWEHIGNTDIDLSNYLAKDNTTLYTPSGDYNPATKKYVDDALGNIDLSNTMKVLYIDDYSTSGTALNMSELDTGVYYVTRKTNVTTLYLKPRNGATARAINDLDGRYTTILVYTDKIPATYSGIKTFTMYQMNANMYGNYIFTDNNTSFSATWTERSASVGLSGSQTVSGTKTFSTIPRQNNTNAPTLDTQFTNKKYVDDSIASAITDALGGSY